ncbi:P-loop containing nucleoside triphosphate hydrolase protein [Pluteus cervinus]|uniref:P-loop containing nucleoside triphosphate hydrolase protein n=1 Tax=Pluteus cervinus TaxID=181527 RepID=A0ACD3A1H0_9AGAR|nr:P-loop containing nucleoside triphosphate hydrolase protein [Pluteus cervinus]
MPSESPAKTRVKRRHNPISQSGRRLRSSNGLATPDPSPSKSAQVVELTDTETDGAEIVPMPRAEIIRVHSDNEREFIHSIKAYLASTRTLPDESDELVALKQSEKELKKKLKAMEKRLDSIQQAMEGKVLVDESKIFNLMPQSDTDSSMHRLNYSVQWLQYTHLFVKRRETLELSKLLERVPIPVKESVKEPAAKINVLLQSYISRLKLDGFVLVADIMMRGWAVPAKAALDLCKMMTPLRQFKGLPQEVVCKAGGKQFPWYHYFDLKPPEIGTSLVYRTPASLCIVSSIVSPSFTQGQPVTRSMLRIDLQITPDFEWDERHDGTAETFLILEDVDGEIILFSDAFVLLQNAFILPDKFPPPTPPLDLQALPLSVLHNPEFKAIYSSTIKTFNKIQTQVFQALYTTDENVFICAPTGSGKTICAEFALLRLWKMVELRVKEWEAMFKNLQGGKEIVSLTGETSADLRLLEKGDLLSVRLLRYILPRTSGALLIADEVQLGGEVGLTYEVVISRTRYETGTKTRIIACGVSLANAELFRSRIGAEPDSTFNIALKGSQRTGPTVSKIRGYDPSETINNGL